MAKNKQLTPEKYITTRGKSLTFHECYINSNWREQGMASIFISKKQPSDNFTVGLFMVDIFCLGLKNTTYNFNLDELGYNQFLAEFKSYNEDVIHCDFSEAHNIIYGAIDFAEDFGFKPNKDFKITEHILDPDLIDDGIDEIELGKDGKPFYIAGPDDNVDQILGILKRNAGEGNFDFLHPQQ
jgi:hypothetical protein